MTDDSPDEESEDVEVECGRCGHTWNYTGDSWKATCPSCGYKTKTPYHEAYDEDDGE
jgi:ribosomal protein L37E